ncbi:MAG: heme-binding domain-containing protein [Phaeodactylibacter sp.]|nr:heme-binding domain-containing protein [Phaeodactylibacter sp.]MCB9265927.1 heme-binding domain-containing protein [Lewinellaceae bacterium]MCB9289717.1 heme-binding domain-containing protein [Lewinellaceae bacterium]
MSKILKWAVLAILAALVIIQFFGIDKTNPPVIEGESFMAVAQPPAEVARLLKDACYDCHSHETEYPWYTSIAPVSWWIGHHIEEGREHLNFSTWGTYNAEKKAHKAEECGEEIEKGEMPLTSYLPMHPEARLTAAQKEQLISWFKELSGESEEGGEAIGPSGAPSSEGDEEYEHEEEEHGHEH